MSVMSSPRNRCRLGVDNPIDDDGFWEFRKFKAKRKGGGPTGGRLWRRTIRTRERRLVRAEIDQYYQDEYEDLQELLSYFDEGDYFEDDYYPEEIFTPWPDESMGCNDDCPFCLAADEQAEIDELLEYFSEGDDDW